MSEEVRYPGSRILTVHRHQNTRWLNAAGHYEELENSLTKLWAFALTRRAYHRPHSHAPWPVHVFVTLSRLAGCLIDKRRRALIFL